jgi:dihydrofolate reductase
MAITASVFVGTSLDGFIARLNGSFDFLPQGGGEEHGYTAFMASVDAMVIGRNTYDVCLGFEAWPYDKPVFVLSTRSIELPKSSSAIVERLEGRPKEIVRVLERRGFRHLYVDGGVTVQRFLSEGLIQRLIITRVPVLIGSGIPLFGPLPHDVALRHVATRQYNSGLVTSEYDIIG